MSVTWIGRCVAALGVPTLLWTAAQASPPSTGPTIKAAVVPTPPVASRAATRPVTEGVELWRGFRKSYPLHLQIVAAGPATATGRIVLVSEPPPHAVSQEVVAVVGADDSMVLRNKIGVDGFTRDLLLHVPPTEQVDFAERMSDLHRYLFSTAYKAEVYPLPVPPPPTTVARQFDLTVSDEDLRRWLPADAAVLPHEGGPPVRFGDLLNGRGGVYESHERGLIVWSVPRGKNSDLSLLRGQARRWAIDSDLVLGAFEGRDCMVLVGRERVVPLLALPPLRAEELARLASVKHDNLAQSYERNFLLAGRFDKQNDWAPIYLSPELVDSEYGSLLNITDQLLKGWSQHGLTVYGNFPYPEPSGYPFKGPLSAQIASSAVTFNWNTRGGGYVVEGMLAVARTGALPVSYLPDGMANKADKPGRDPRELESEGFAYYNRTGDPNLARVVQYAAAYQAFRAFDVHATAPPLAEAPKGVALLRDRFDAALRQLGTPQGQNALADNLFAKRPVFNKLTADQRKEIRDAVIEVAKSSEVRLRKLDSEHKSEGRMALLDALVDPRAPRFNSLREKLDRRGLALLSDKDKASEAAFALAFELGELDSIFDSLFSESLFRCLIDVNELQQSYAKAYQDRRSGWIRTPSIVMSHCIGETAKGIGGHNLDAKLIDVVTDAAVAKGSVAVEGPVGKRVLRVNPADRGRANDLIWDAARLDPSVAVAKAKAVLAMPPRPPRPPGIALAAPGGPPWPPEGGPRGLTGLVGEIGGRGRRVTGVPTPEQADALARSRAVFDADPVLIARDGPDGHRLMEFNAQGPIRAESMTQLQDAILEKLSMSAGGRSPKAADRVVLEFDEIDAAQAEAVVQSLRVRGRKLRMDVESISALHGTTADRAAFKSMTERLGRGDWSRAEFTDLLIKKTLKGTTEVRFDVTVPVAGEKVPLGFRVRAVFRQLADNVQDAIARIIRKPRVGKSGAEILRELRSELRALGGITDDDIRFEVQNAVLSDAEDHRRPSPVAGPTGLGGRPGGEAV